MILVKGSKRASLPLEFLPKLNTNSPDEKTGCLHPKGLPTKERRGGCQHTHLCLTKKGCHPKPAPNLPINWVWVNMLNQELDRRNFRPFPKTARSHSRVHLKIAEPAEKGWFPPTSLANPNQTRGVFTHFETTPMWGLPSQSFTHSHLNMLRITRKPLGRFFDPPPTANAAISRCVLLGFHLPGLRGRHGLRGRRQRSLWAAHRHLGLRLGLRLLLGLEAQAKGKNTGEEKGPFTVKGPTRLINIIYIYI